MSLIASRPIILGSSSKWRRKELEAIGLAFDVMSADIDEKAIRHSEPAILTLHVAVAKAQALLGRIDRPSWLITCDQVAVFRGEIREKPADEDQARRAIHATHEATAHFAPLPVPAVERAVRRGDVLGSCGAFTIDDPELAPYVDGLYGEGDQAELRSSISGLPRAATLALLDRIAG